MHCTSLAFVDEELSFGQWGHDLRYPAKSLLLCIFSNVYNRRIISGFFFEVLHRSTLHHLNIDSIAVVNQLDFGRIRISDFIVDILSLDLSLLGNHFTVHTIPALRSQLVL